MAQIPPLYNENQQLDESELEHSLANKAPRSHKAMRISQGFNPEILDLATFVEHWERDETTDNIAMAKFSASEKDSDTKKNKNRSKKTKNCEYMGKKQHKTPHFIIASMVKTIVTPQGSAKSSMQGLHINTIRVWQKGFTRKSSRNLISWRKKLPTKKQVWKYKQSFHQEEYF